METYKLSSFKPRAIVIDGRDANGNFFDARAGDPGVTVTVNGSPYDGRLFHLNVGETATVVGSIEHEGKRYSCSVVVEGSATEGFSELILTTNIVEDIEPDGGTKEPLIQS